MIGADTFTQSNLPCSEESGISHDCRVIRIPEVFVCVQVSLLLHLCQLSPLLSADLLILKAQKCCGVNSVDTPATWPLPGMQIHGSALPPGHVLPDSSLSSAVAGRC